MWVRARQWRRGALSAIGFQLSASTDFHRFAQIWVLVGSDECAEQLAPSPSVSCCSMSAYQGLRPWQHSSALRAVGCAASARPPGGNMSCSMSAYQGLRPWLRSRALRAETGTIHCPPGTTFHTLCEGTGHVPPPSALRAGTGIVRCPPTRDFVPGYVRAPSGREEDGDLAPQPTSIPLRPEGG